MQWLFHILIIILSKFSRNNFWVSSEDSADNPSGLRGKRIANKPGFKTFHQRDALLFFFLFLDVPYDRELGPKRETLLQNSTTQRHRLLFC